MASGTMKISPLASAGWMANVLVFSFSLVYHSALSSLAFCLGDLQHFGISSGFTVC